MPKHKPWIINHNVAKPQKIITLLSSMLCEYRFGDKLDEFQVYLPLPMEGNAIDFSFFSSASAKQFFTVFSNNSSHLSEPQLGLLQWITNFAGNPCPELTTAG